MNSLQAEALKFIYQNPNTPYTQIMEHNGRDQENINKTHDATRSLESLGYITGTGSSRDSYSYVLTQEGG